MRILVQRVTRASVSIEGKVVGEIGPGLLLLAGFTAGDSDAGIEWMAEKVCGLRIFNDSAGKMNLDVGAIGGTLLVVSQFTLYGDAARGRRPSFIDAAPPDLAIPLYEAFVAALRRRGLTVATGRVGADMQVELVNDGPVTLMLEREPA